MLAQREDVIQQSNLTSLLKQHPAIPPSHSFSLSWTLTHPSFFLTLFTSHPACCLLSCHFVFMFREYTVFFEWNTPGVHFSLNWSQRHIALSRKKQIFPMNDSDKSTMNKKLVKYCTYRHLETAVFETEYMVGTVLCIYIYTIRMRNGNTPSYSLSPSCSLCGNLHSMMSLFPIIPWQLPVPSKQSLPTPWPCQSNLSNLSKGQRPKCSSGIPINIYSIHAPIKLWWLQTAIRLIPY